MITQNGITMGLCSQSFVPWSATLYVIVSLNFKLYSLSNYVSPFSGNLNVPRFEIPVSDGIFGNSQANSYAVLLLFSVVSISPGSVRLPSIRLSFASISSGSVHLPSTWLILAYCCQSARSTRYLVLNESK